MLNYYDFSQQKYTHKSSNRFDNLNSKKKRWVFPCYECMENIKKLLKAPTSRPETVQKSTENVGMSPNTPYF